MRVQECVCLFFSDILFGRAIVLYLLFEGYWTIFFPTHWIKWKSTITSIELLRMIKTDVTAEWNKNNSKKSFCDSEKCLGKWPATEKTIHFFSTIYWYFKGKELEWRKKMGENRTWNFVHWMRTSLLISIIRRKSIIVFDKVIKNNFFPSSHSYLIDAFRTRQKWSHWITRDSGIPTDFCAAIS